MKLNRINKGSKKYEDVCDCGNRLEWYMRGDKLVNVLYGEHILKDGKDVIRCRTCMAEYELVK